MYRATLGFGCGDQRNRDGRISDQEIEWCQHAPGRRRSCLPARGSCRGADRRPDGGGHRAVQCGGVVRHRQFGHGTGAAVSGRPSRCQSRRHGRLRAAPGSGRERHPRLLHRQPAGVLRAARTSRPHRRRAATMQHHGAAARSGVGVRPVHGRVIRARGHTRSAVAPQNGRVAGEAGP